MSGSNCCFMTCIQISQEVGKVVWYSHLFKNFPQFIVIHTVKSFGIVKKAEVDVFLEPSCFFYDPTDVGNLISGSFAFSKSSLSIWKFTVHVLLKAGPVFLFWQFFLLWSWLCLKYSYSSFLLMSVTWNVFLHLFTCNPSVSLYVRWASCRYVIGSCFLFMYVLCLFGCPSSCSLWDLVPDQGLNPGPMFGSTVLATGPLEKSPALFFNPFWLSLSFNFFNLGHSCLKWLLIKLDYYLTYLLLFSILLPLFIVSISSSTLSLPFMVLTEHFECFAFLPYQLHFFFHFSSYPKVYKIHLQFIQVHCQTLYCFMSSTRAS